MPRKTVTEVGHPPLTDFISFSPLSEITNYGAKGLARLIDYVWALCYVYEIGALLGRARHTKMGLLEKILVFPNGDVPNLKHWQEKARYRLEKYKERFGEEPDNFREFILIMEYDLATGRKVMDDVKTYRTDSLRDKDRIRGAAFKSVPLSFSERENSRRIGETETKIREFVLEGIGFGSAFSELTEKMIRGCYESIHLESNKLYKANKENGYIVPSRILNLEEQEEGILIDMARYAKDYYPTLLDPLDLGFYSSITGVRGNGLINWWNTWTLLYEYV